MAKPDIKLTSVVLNNFRGAKNTLTLDLGRDGRSCAVFGENGEGKSSITQAIEWFYKDTIAALKGEMIDDKDIVNVAAKAGEETTVGLFFTKSDLSATKTFVDGRRRTSFDNRKQEFITYHEGDAQYDRLYLNQYTIAKFLWETKGDKRKQIANIVGLEDIVNVKGVISGALNELQRSPKLRDLETRLQYNQGQLTSEIFGEPVSTLEGLFEQSEKLLKKLSIQEQVSSIDSLEKLLEKALRALPNADRAKEKVALEGVKQEISNYMAVVDYAKPLKEWLIAYGKLVKDKDSIVQINLYDFLLQAEKVLEHDHSMKDCPLCGQKIDDADALLKAVVERYKKLSELRTRLETVQSEMRKVTNAIQSGVSRLGLLENGLKGKDINFNEVLLTAYTKNSDDIISKLQDGFPKKEGIDVDEALIQKSIVELKAELNRLTEVINKKIEGLALTAEERTKLDLYNKLIRGKQSVLDNISMAKEIAAFKTQIKEMGVVETQLLQLQNETLQKVLDIISDDVNRYFHALNKKDGLRKAKLELVGEEGIEFSLEFYGNKAVPPRKYLSESQINSLGISFFLAAVKNFNKVNCFFILDDVLLSFDKNYRIRLLDLLQSDFSEHQILLLTHEEYWFEMIKRKFPDWVYKEVEWAYDSGIKLKDSKLDRLDDIRNKHRNGEKVGNDLRAYLESLLKDVCFFLEVRLPFRIGMDNERRMVGELFPALTSTLCEHRSSVRDSQDYKDLEMSSFVANIIAHHNPDLESDGDTAETIEKIAKFRDMFRCDKGRFISRNISVPGQKQIACKCGCKTIEWH